MCITQKKLHIVSFDIPYPPNYGGAIDVFYKLKALSKLDVSIILHCFEQQRERQEVLQQYCEKVYYYPRNSFFFSLFSRLPFVVKTRENQKLIHRLNQDKAPVLFEGIHTAFPLYSKVFLNKLSIVRMHNIEHFYYQGLAKSERNIFKKLFYKLEAQKLKRFEKVLAKAQYLLTIAPFETDYYNKLFPDKVIFVPPFHENTSVASLSNKGSFAFYHGDLKISDNRKAAHFLVDLFADIDYPLVIGGGFYPKGLQKKIAANPSCSFVDISKNNLGELFAAAHINILPSYQKTGIKLKLINTLYQSRFVIGNDAILEDTGMESICVKANSPDEFKKAIKDLIHTDYTPKHQIQKQEVLQNFDVSVTVKQIVALL